MKNFSEAHETFWNQFRQAAAQESAARKRKKEARAFLLKAFGRSKKGKLPSGLVIERVRVDVGESHQEAYHYFKIEPVKTEVKAE